MNLGYIVDMLKELSDDSLLQIIKELEKELEERY